MSCRYITLVLSIKCFFLAVVLFYVVWMLKIPRRLFFFKVDEQVILVNVKAVSDSQWKNN